MGTVERLKLELQNAINIGDSTAPWTVVDAAKLLAAFEQVKELEAFLARNGFRQCDIAACNCGSYHGGHASDRLREISDEVWENGKSVLDSVIDLKKANTQLTERAERAEKLQSDIARLLRNKNRPELELLIYDNDGENFGVRLLDREQTGVGHCVQRRISFDLPFVIASFVEWSERKHTSEEEQARKEADGNG